MFDSKYPINNSEQLYYRFVPLMADIELLEIKSRLGSELFDKLKQDDLSDELYPLLNSVREVVVYETLIKAYKLFPIEMFPDKVDYNPKTNATEETIKEAVIINLEKELNIKYNRLEHLVSDLKNEYQEPKDFLQGLKNENKHIDL